MKRIELNGEERPPTNSMQSIIFLLHSFLLCIYTTLGAHVNNKKNIVLFCISRCSGNNWIYIIWYVCGWLVRWLDGWLVSGPTIIIIIIINRQSLTNTTFSVTWLLFIIVPDFYSESFNSTFVCSKCSLYYSFLFFLFLFKQDWKWQP